MKVQYWEDMANHSDPEDSVIGFEKADDARRFLAAMQERMGKWLNRVVRGYLNYHAVPGNLYRLGSMCKDINRAEVQLRWMGRGCQCFQKVFFRQNKPLAGISIGFVDENT